MVYGAYTRNLSDWIFSLGLSGYFYQGFKNQAAPDISAGYFLRDDLKLRSSFSKSFRAPSFSRRTSIEVSNIGNKKITPEKTHH